MSLANTTHCRNSHQLWPALEAPAAPVRQLAQLVNDPFAAARAWRVVPLVPTPEMVDAWSSATSLPHGIRDRPDDEVNAYIATRDYQAMLAAAPVHPERTALTDERISFIIQETEDNSMYGRDHNGWLHQVARSVERACTAAAPQAPAAPSAHAGLLAAAAHIQAKAQAHLDERGSYDPDTGAVEMSESNQEHFNTLDELAEEIRMLAEKAAPASDQAIDQAIATHTNTEGANQ